MADDREERPEHPEPPAGGVAPGPQSGRVHPEAPLRMQPVPTPEQVAAQARARRRRRRAAWAGGVLLLLLVVGSLLYLRCGLRGCPDVDMLKGYMPEEASRVVDREGEEIAKLFVTRRVVIGIDSLPQHLQDAFIAIEDRRFREHGGVDWRRVLGALARNVQAGGIEEGSSTITMQLARNVFPEKLPANEKTLWRKLGEARVARQIEGSYRKDEILQMYLNQIYFGHGAYGIESAAQEYFGKSATDLTLAESATLAALPRAPSRLNPRSNPGAAQEGRELVLTRMAEQGLITAEQRDEAADADLRLRQRTAKSQERAPYFVEAVRRLLEVQLGDALYTEGYTIHTTLDLGAQGAAERALSAQLQAVESGRYGTFRHRTYASLMADTTTDASAGTQYLQGAMIVMEAATGDVLALIGGRDFDDSEFNRATQAQRQPGSAFKPFVYAAALQAGIPATHRLIDQPLRMVIDGGRVWEPRNYESGYSGVVTMRQALMYSKNVATVRLANEVGLGAVLRVAENMGLGRMQAHPAVVLGTAEVTPIGLTSAYGAFATLGNRPHPRFVTRVVDRHGATVWSQPSSTERVIDPAVAFLTVSMMQDVVNRGTGTGVRAVGFRGTAAGKTGTTQDAADVWFVGITPEIVATVWVGFDKRQRILSGATGGEIAAPVWGRVMNGLDVGRRDWAVPNGIETRLVTPQGSVVDESCPASAGAYREFFLRGTTPYVDCFQDQFLAYSDSLGLYSDSVWEDYERRRVEEDGWWDRMRSRIFGRDSSGVRPAQPRDTLGRELPPGIRPAQPRPGQPADSVDPGDTTRPRPARPLGDPVPGPLPPRPDTARPRPTPDTTPPSPAPPDTTTLSRADTVTIGAEGGRGLVTG
ncbi:MAG TPA: PBP1A family penicillin-binding protein [Longimicrobiales bacterium]|nr:PBP1A family penicillin-binding protein [Longimicrobiales bacterium]